MLRIVTFSLDPVTFGQTKQYAYVLNDPNGSVSEITALSNTEFLVDERDGRFPGDPVGTPSTIKNIYRINIAGATDISDPANSAGGLLVSGKTLEQLVNSADTSSTRGANTQAIERRVLQGQPAPLTALVPGLDPEVNEIVMRALKREPVKRYQDAATF